MADETGGIAANEGIAESTEESQGIAEESGESRGVDTGASDRQEPKAADSAPETYELEAPEDFPLPAENLKSFNDAALKLGLSREQAMGMLQWHKDFHESVSGQMAQNSKAMLQGWNREIQQDKDFGGANWKATLADARKALDVFDTDGALREMLRESQYQHNPVVIRAIARIGRAMGEHDFVGRDGAGKKSDTPLEDRLYSKMESV